jgi:hypothetical protein
MKRLLLILTVAASALAAASSAGADQSYSDPRGDAGVGTDIIALTVRNDSAGNLSIQVASASPIVPNHAIAIFVDTDRNASTGSPTGDEYVMFGGPATGVTFGVWNGSQLAGASPPSFSVGAVASNITEFRINKTDLGNVSSFNFVGVSVSLDPPDPNLHFWDVAPNAGKYSYTLSGPPPPPSPATTQTTPTSSPPDATFDLTSGPYRVGKRIVFTARHSGYPSYEWDFGDGTTATGRKVSHTYRSGGEYTVVLTVENEGGEGTDYRTVKVGAATSENGGCLINTDKCPTIFGPSARSRKDPEYSRFASRMAGGPRSVFCWNESDWAQLSPESKTTIAFGFVEFRSPHQIHLSPKVCTVLDRIHYHHQTPPITPAIAFALVTFTHEMFHTLGIKNEAAAECFGMQYIWRASRLLGAGAEYGERVALLAWRLYSPRVLPPAYLSRECHDGGKLDLFPKSHVWP